MCKFCEKFFSIKGYLSRHECTHTGEKLFTGSSCEKRFFQNGILTSHERMYTGDKQFTF